MRQNNRKQKLKRWRNRQRDSRNLHVSTTHDRVLAGEVHTVDRLEPRLLMSASTPSILGSPVDPLAGLEVNPLWFANVTPTGLVAQGAGSALLNKAPTTTTIQWYGSEVEAVVDQWLVQLNTDGVNAVNGVGDVDALLGLANMNAHVVQGLGLEGMVLIEAENSLDDDRFIQSMKSSSYVAAIDHNVVISANFTPNDSYFSSLWGLHNTGQSGGTSDADIDAPEAWDITTGDGSTIVAVIDTGVDYNHSDLNDNIWRNGGEIANNGVDDDGNGFIDDVFGWDFANNDSSPMDDNGHGTHVAGTIAAEGNNSRGVIGVAPDVKIMALKFLNAGGSGFVSHAMQAVNYATMMRNTYNENVRVLNNSWGGGGSYSPLKNAIESAKNAGILFVAAAGNDGTNNDSNPQYPANYNVSNVLSVAATDRNDILAGFSNYGRNTVDLAAPGVSIRSTLPNDNYGYYSGTSMATPHVAGVAALLWSHNPDLSVSDVKNAILNGVDNIGSLSNKVATGGRLNALKALQQINGNPSPDRFENNDSAAQVASKNEGVSNSPNLGQLWNEITLSGLNTVDDAEDWFRFEMNDRGSASNYIRIEYNDVQGNLNLAVYEADGVTLVGQSTGTDNDDQVSLNGEDAGVYYVRVWAVDNAVVMNYKLNIRPAVDLADLFEENDSRATVDGRSVGATNSPNLGYVSGTRDLTGLNMLDDANDYFLFRTLDRGGRGHAVKASFIHANGDLDMALYNSDGTLIGSSYSIHNSESISLSGLDAGTYYVRVYGYSGASNPSYSLTIKAPQGPRDRVGNDQNSAKGHRGFNKPKQYDELVGYGDNADYYRVKFKRGGQLDLSLSNLTGSADLTLINIHGDTLGTLSLGSGASASASSMVQTLATGTYFAIVSTASQDPVNYTLTVEAERGPKDKAGDTPDRAKKVRRLKKGKVKTYSEHMGFGDVVDYYRIKVKKQSSDVEIDLNNLTGDADVELLNENLGVIDASSNSGTTSESISQRLTPGIYYVRVTTDSEPLLSYDLNLSGTDVEGAGSSGVTAAQLTLAAIEQAQQRMAVSRSALAQAAARLDASDASMTILDRDGEEMSHPALLAA